MQHEPAARSEFRRRVLWAALLAVATLAAGCAVTPAPDGAAIRDEALQGVALRGDWAGAVADGDVTDGWLASFDDAELERLVEEALQANPDLRAVGARVEQSQARLAAAQGMLKPAISLLGSGSSNFGSDFGGLTGAILSVSWELDLWGRLRYARNAAGEDLAAAQSDFAFARQLLAARVAQAWFTATQLALQRALANEQVQASDELVALARRRLAVGASDERDVVLAEASANQYRDAAAQIDLAYSQAVRALELLLGRYPAAEVEARDELPAPPAEVPAGQPLQMLERRPDLVAAERRVAAAFDRIGEAQAAKLPMLALTASGSYIDSEVLVLKEDFDTPSAGGAVRLMAPLYTGGQLSAQVELRTAQQREAVAAYAGAALAAIGDVENALNATRTLEQRRAVLELASTQNERALELEKVSFKVGRSDLRDVLRQQVQLYGTRNALLAVRGDQLVQRVNLYLSLGGNFAPAIDDAPAPAVDDAPAAASAPDDAPSLP